jgi:hypothetical protein
MRKTTNYFIDWGDYEIEFEVVDGGHIQVVGNCDLFGNQIGIIDFREFVNEVKRMHVDVEGE